MGLEARAGPAVKHWMAFEVGLALPARNWMVLGEKPGAVSDSQPISWVREMAALAAQ